MKFAIASLLVSFAVPALAVPTLNCSVNGRTLRADLGESSTASLVSTEGAYVVKATATRSGGYKGSPVQDQVTIALNDASGELVAVTALSAAALRTDAKGSALLVQCAVTQL